MLIALGKGTNVVLVLVETTGAVHPNVAGMLRAWHNEANEPGRADRTKYGTSRSATRSFFSHHLRATAYLACCCHRLGHGDHKVGPGGTEQARARFHGP